MNNNINKTWEYLLKEAEYLRSTYVELRKETRALEAYTLLAIGVILSWCAANPKSSAIAYLLWLPFTVVNIFGIRAFGVYMQMVAIRKYLVVIESSSAQLPDGLGWERFLNTDSMRAIWPITAFAFWILLAAITSILPFLLN